MTLVKRIFLWLQGLFYLFAGTMHFLNPQAYMPMMPPYLPWHRELILLSGAAELILGIGVLVPRTRTLAAWGIILLLIAILPANLHVALNNVPLFGATQGLGAGNWARLPFQLVLAWWAYLYTRPDAQGASAPARA